MGLNTIQSLLRLAVGVRRRHISALAASGIALALSFGPSVGSNAQSSIEDPRAAIASHDLQQGNPAVKNVTITSDPLKTTVTITGEVVDDGSVADLTVEFSGAVTGTTKTDANGKFSKSFPYPAIVPAAVDIVAEDEDGNQSQVVTKIIR